jgi:hypothetical protein
LTVSLFAVADITLTGQTASHHPLALPDDQCNKPQDIISQAFHSH